MKDSIKRFAGRVVAVVSALSFFISSLSFSASADTNYQLTSISNDVFRAILLQGSDHLNGYYLSTDGSYKPCTFVPRAYFTTFVGSDISGGVQNHLAQSSCLSFGCTDYGSDIALTGNFLYPIFKIPLNLHFGNVKECYYGCTYYVGNTSFYDYPIGSIRPYAYMVAGSYNSSITYIGANSSGFPNRATITTASGAPLSLFTSILGSFFSSGSDFYISELDICCADLGNGEANISVIVPRLNNDYIIFSNSEPPSFSSSSGSASGTITDSDGNVSNIDVDVSLSVPDYSGQLSQLANPSLTDGQSAALSELDDANDAAGQAISDFDDIVDDIDSYEWEIDGDSFALDTIDQDLPDLTPPTDIVDGVNDLWELLELDRSAPIILRYMPILILFMFGSYVIFGKWI